MHSKSIPIERLDRVEFAAALRKGQGRALLHVLHYGLDDVADLVLEACLHNQVYDQLCESFRGDWLLSMYKDSAHFLEFRAAILSALGTEPIGNNLYQLLLMARDLALEGDTEAHKDFGEALFRIAATPDSHDWLGVEDWIDLEGTEGLLQLARLFGQRLLANPDDRVIPVFLDFEAYPDYKRILDEFSDREITIETFRKYLENCERERDSREEVGTHLRSQDRLDHIRKKYTLTSILDDARKWKGKNPSHYASFGRRAAHAELEAVYRSLLNEPDEKARTRMLWVFRRVKLPHLDDVLFEWAELDNDEMRAASIAALANISDTRVHDLARKKVITGRLLGADSKSLGLFLENFEIGDALLIDKGLVNLRPGPEDAHALGSSILDLAERHGVPDLAKAMLWTYENTPCSFCRLSVVEELQKTDWMTDTLRLECQYDADEEIRELVQRMSAD